MSRVVAGTLLLPNGQPMANASIYFTAKRTEPVSIIEGSNTFFNTNGAGVYNQTVVNGFYAVSIEYIADSSGAHTRRWPLGDVFIEDGAASTLEALIIASNAPDDLALGVFYEILEQAQAAAASAQASAVAAENSAASVTPTTGPNDTVPGRLWRTNDLVKTVGATGSVAGSVVTVGNHGWAGIPDDLSDYNTPASAGRQSGFFITSGTTANKPAGIPASTVGMHLRRNPGGNEVRLEAVATDTASAGRIFYNYRSVGSWNSAELYGSHNQISLGLTAASARAAINSSLLPVYTLATVPAVAANINLQIIISNLTGGREPCYSDGTNWRRGSDKTVAN